MKKANTIPAITSTVRQLALHAQFLLNSKQSRKYKKSHFLHYETLKQTTEKWHNTKLL